MSSGQRLDALRRAFNAPPWLLDTSSDELVHSLDIALTHDSFSNELSMKGKDEPANERLEFLGDAALELAVREYVYRGTPLREGDMTGFKQKLVSNDNLAELFDRRLSALLPHLRVGVGQKNEIGPRIKAGCIEALFGAVYLNMGMEKVNDICVRLLFQDPRFQELLHAYLLKQRSFHQNDLDR